MKSFNEVMRRFGIPLCNAVPQNTIESNETLNAYFETLEREYGIDESDLNPPEPKDDKEEENATK